jgi:signal transduction histidine kinase
VSDALAPDADAPVAGLPGDRLRTVFPGDGEMAARSRAHDWAATPLGPVEGWPQSLRATVRTLLSSRYPMVLTWGPAFTQLYNDAYAAVIGSKHPGALGEDIRVTLAEAWDVLGPMIARVMATGVANWTPALPLLLERAGYREESYFSVSHAPAADDEGRVEGMLAVCSEVTEQVVGDRRLRLLRDLAAQAGVTAAGEARTVERTCEDAAAAMAGHPLDLPFALLYLREPGTDRFVRHAAVGLGGAPAAAADASGWPLLRAAAGETVFVHDVADRLAVSGGFFGDPVRAALALPLAGARQEGALGVLVAGVSPNRALDDGYRSFYALLAGQVAVALRNARAYEEERRRAEALAEVDRAKTQFFSNVSHEFRTPLTLMLGPLEDALARRGALPPEVAADLDVAHRNARRLLKLVNTLLAFTRVEAGRAQAAFAPADLAARTAELASTFRAAAERAGLRLTVDAPPLPEPVYVDRAMWEQVVLNLLSNALKHTFAGEIAVAVRAAGGAAEVTVRDTGVGIPAEELPRLFERFRQVPGRRARTHEGSGIGLALVHELVRLHGGAVAVESAVGVGTTFRVTVPFGVAHLPADQLAEAEPEDWHSPDDAAATAASSGVSTAGVSTTAAAFADEAALWTAGAGPEAPAGRAPGDGAAAARVLLVDDNADMRAYVARLLAARGWAVTTAADGVEGLAAARRDPPDLVLADVMMPGLDGFALLAELRRDPRTRAVPVVLLSARAGEEARVEGLDAGADDYLVKPFAARELVARVAANLELARMRRDAADRERRAESAEAASRAKGELLTNLSHELRTPINATLGYLELIELGLRGAVTPGQREDIGRIRRSQRHLLGLVDNILTFSRLEADRVEYAPEAVHVHALLAELGELVAPQAWAKSLAYTYVPCAPGLAVRADRTRLRQIVVNLLSNAVKFTPPGGRVTLACEAGEGPAGRAVRLRVTDTGPGVPADKLETVFAPFVQLDQGLARAHEGTGLGLAISRDLARGMGGDLTAESAPGAGSTFTLTLPAA